MIRSGIVVAGRHGQAQADLAEAKLPILLRGRALCPSLPEAGAAAPEKKSGEAQRGVCDRSRNIVSLGPFAIFKILNSISQVLLGPFAIFKILNSISHVLLGSLCYLQSPEQYKPSIIGSHCGFPNPE